MTVDLYERLSQDQARFQTELNNILDKSYQPMVVKFLLMLLGNRDDKKGIKPPKWFMKSVQVMLSSRLMIENGVMNVVRGVLDLGGEGDSFDWTKVNMVEMFLGILQSTQNMLKLSFTSARSV